MTPRDFDVDVDPTFVERVGERLEAGEIVAFDTRHRRQDGTVFPVEVRARPFWQGGRRFAVSLVRDITERKRAEQRLVAQHTVTQILAEAATLEDATPRILQAVCECLLWDLGALWRIDREAGVLRCVEVWPKESVEAAHFEATSRASTFLPGIGLPGRVWSSRAPAYIPDVVHDASFLRAPIAAREGLHAAFAFPILLGGDVLGVIEFFSHEIRQPDQDLLHMMATIGSQIGQFIERQRAEAALHHAQAELAHVTRVATLGELTASIAHEVNQPLAAVVTNGNACLRWLTREPPNLEEVREAVRRMIRDGNRAGEVIARMRALVRKAEPQKARLAINDVIAEVIALADSELRRHGVALHTDLAAALPPVLGDRIQLQQVLLNLLLNGMEALRGVTDRPRALIASHRSTGSRMPPAAGRVRPTRSARFRMAPSIRRDPRSSRTVWTRSRGRSSGFQASPRRSIFGTRASERCPRRFARHRPEPLHLKTLDARLRGHPGAVHAIANRSNGFNEPFIREVRARASIQARDPSAAGRCEDARARPARAAGDPGGDRGPHGAAAARRHLPHAVVRVPGAPQPLGLAAVTIYRHMSRIFVTVCQVRPVRRPPPHPSQAAHGVLQPTFRGACQASSRSGTGHA